MQKNIVIVGAGAWGTSIANLLAHNNHNVCAISDVNEICEEINKNHTHQKALPNIKLEKNLCCSILLQEEAENADYIFIVVPSNAVISVLKQISSMNLKSNCGFIFATKGLEHNSLKFFHEIFAEIFQNRNFAVLSGPNFAIEVAQKIPTITNIASKNQNFASEICNLIQNDFFRPSATCEVLVAEISAVIKNIMAIACGICDGLNFGENTKAALIVKGVEEIKQLAKALGQENPNTENAAGFGDIFLTCSTTKSRNNSLGKAIGMGQKYSELAKTKTYEGAINAESVAKLSKKLGLELKLCEIINKILQKEPEIKNIKEEIISIIK